MTIRRPFTTLVAAAAVTWLVGACGGATGEQSGGETHFLRACDGTCGEGLSCIAGLCTRSCVVDAGNCSDLSEGASCTNTSIEPGSVAVCDQGCSADADCAGLTGEHRCEGGFCRAPAAVAGGASEGIGSGALPLSGRISLSGPFLGTYAFATTIGDMDGDGLPDVALADNTTMDQEIPASGRDLGSGGVGTVHILHGRRLWDTSARIDESTLRLERSSGGTDLALDRAGDVNGDGYADLLIATRHGEAVDECGRAVVYIVFGSAERAEFSNAGLRSLLLRGPCGSDAETPTAGAADLDGDGYRDVVLRHGGRLYGFYGGQDRSVGRAGFNDASFVIEPAQNGGLNPFWVTGDYNGDGLADLFFQNGEDGAYVLLGRARRFVGTVPASGVLARLFQGDTVVAGFLGDLDGDGTGEVMVNVGLADGRHQYAVFRGQRTPAFRGPDEASTVYSGGATSHYWTRVTGGADLRIDGRPHVVIPLAWEDVVVVAPVDLSRTAFDLSDARARYPQRQLVPIVATADLDGDGLNELIVGNQPVTINDEYHQAKVDVVSGEQLAADATLP